MMPVIGISAFPNTELRIHKTNTKYVQAVVDAGATPLLLPVTGSQECAERMVKCIDGLLLPGGPDLDPLLYGEEPLPQIGATCRQNDTFECTLLRAARMAKKPILGVCRGMQVINVCFGGTLWQDLPSQTGAKICHTQDKLARAERTHTVILEPGSLLHQVMGVPQALVNTYHHQAVRDAAIGFRVSARAKDGVIEAIESDDGILAVQWHPEELQQYEEEANLFRYLVERCAR